MTRQLYERKYHDLGYQFICGVDEAGRGPLAGPVVAAAVILPIDFYDESINDSKKLSKKERDRLRLLIEQHALSISISVIDSNRIDEINILEASREAMILAVKNLKIQPDFILTDYMYIGDLPHLSLKHGDSLSISIAAASIIAKTKRDELMMMYDQIYPEYGFIKHQGYGTKMHLEALKKYGITPIHRKSYKPVYQIMNDKTV
ncbi:ribonuclease HII [Acholeplasma oculi]|uniref:Ribonuclease HII n=1 Tax=Acholeplasma oculi TaxID=35623 RepID=A0A061AJK3_9MOLU|nr:ribonuclease HII [Acholeplasma oculi]CDR31172.1 Ribonuclease HII [Acholeplasma oculi]